MNFRFFVIRCVGSTVLLLGGFAMAQPAPLTGPAESFDVKNQLPPLTDAVQAKNYPDAAARVDALLQGGNDAMFQTSPEVMTSLKAWVESLSSPSREGIETEYDKIVGPAAKGALDAVVTKPGSTPEDYITVANTYLLSNSAGDAYGRAALRAIDYGDVTAAQVLAQRAKTLGWKSTDAQKSLLDSVAKLSLLTASSLQFAATWYEADPPQTTKRVIPVHAGGMVFVSTERGVMAAKESGEMLWQSPTQKPDPKAEPSMSGARFGLHRPAVLCDPAGKPQIVIVRQLVNGTRFGCLRAFRASDGKPLWTTESGSMGSWSLASAPVIAGRVVMVIGIDDSVRPAPVAVLAFETMTGRLIWTSRIGGYDSLSEGRDVGTLREVDMLWNNSGVAIDGSDVFVNAGMAMTFCLDRFDGKIKWVRSYTPTLTPGDDLMAAGRRTLRHEPGSNEPYKAKQKELRARLGDVVLQVTPIEGEKKNREISAEIMAMAMYFWNPARWLSTPIVAGDLVFVAGSDMGGIVALDRRTGSQTWESTEDLKESTLIGLAGDNAVLAGSGLTGLDIRTGKVVWTWTVPNDGTISGPPSMTGKAVRVVSGKTTYVISSDTGKPDALTSVGTGFGPVLANEASRSALTNIDAFDSFAAATVQKAPPPREPAEPKDPKKKK